jgi:hypothetical protein
MSAQQPLYKRIAADIAAQLIAHPEQWTQGSMYRDAAGNSSLDCHESEAVCFCLWAHINKRVNGAAMLVAGHETRLFRAALGVPSLSEFNDAPGRTVEQIIEACKRVAS